MTCSTEQDHLSTWSSNNADSTAAAPSFVTVTPASNNTSNGPRTATLPMYGLSTSRGVPMPLPRTILEAEYPDSPDIVDALCRIRLSDDAPRRGLTVNEVKHFTEGWDAGNISVHLQPPRAHVGSLQGDVPVSDPKDIQNDDTHCFDGQELGFDCSSFLSQTALFSSERIDIPTTNPPTDTVFKMEPGPIDESSFAPASLFISIPAPNPSFSSSGNSDAPDILIMTPLEGPNDGADPFDDGSMAFTLAAARASPDRTLIQHSSASPSTANILVDAAITLPGLQEMPILIRPPEVEAALQTARRLIEEARAAATARYDGTSAANVATSVHETGDDMTTDLAIMSADTAECDPASSCSSSFVLVSTSPSPSFSSLSTSKTSSPCIDLSMADRPQIVSFDSSCANNESPEALSWRSVDENDDSKSTTSSIATVTQGSPDVIGLDADSCPLSPVPSLPRPHNVPQTDDSKPLRPCEGTEEDHIRVILHCEADITTGIDLNRNPTRFSMWETGDAKHKVEEYNAYNLGPSCSWAPYFFDGKPKLDLQPVADPDNVTARKRAHMPVPYISQLGVTDSPLALPMGTRVINFLPDFEVNSPIRCFLHTSCNGPPPPAVPLPILHSLPSFGITTTDAKVTTLPAEPPPAQGQRTESRASLTTNSIRSPTIAEYASSVGAYKEWTHTCIALHQIAGHITASQVESAATGLADLIRLLIKNAHRMGLLSQSLNEESCMPPSKHVALYYKQVFWAKFVALAFAVFSEHALRVDLVTGDSDWAKSVPEAAVMEALIIPDRSQTPTPTPLTGRVFRLDGFLSLDNMIPEYWWRYGRNLDTAWDEFLNKFCERQSMSPIYNEVETETTHEPHPAISRLQDDPVESEYEGYNTYRDFGIIEDLSLAYDDVSKVHVPLLTSMDEEIEEEVENKYQEETREDEGFGAFKGVTKSQLLANPSSLNLMSQFTAVRIRGGLQALANVIFGGIDGANELVAREDTESVLAREQLDMLQAMADDSFYGYERLLQWQPREGPRSHTGIRAMRQKLANIYRHPLELYSAVV